MKGVVGLDDLFEHEQAILNDALRNAAETKCVNCGELAKEYGRLLKQLRRATKISDRTTQSLNKSRHDLFNKVHFDVLTGIYNRRFLDENLTQIIKSISRSGGELGVLMIDIDYFKNYNDAYGHSEGDVCLKTVAEAITGSLSRSDDFAARYGGEEFAVVLPDTGENGACLIAERILENIRGKNIPHQKSEAADHVTISIGATASKAFHTQTGEDYIMKADEALYRSKRSGRNRCTYTNMKEER
jgi:diguanylate cyclase (GGDEF)-like protein